MTNGLVGKGKREHESLMNSSKDITKCLRKVLLYKDIMLVDWSNVSDDGDT